MQNSTPSPSPGLRSAIRDLDAVLEGDIVDDPLTLTAYSSDASLYRIVPQAVAFPRSAADCRAILDFARGQGLCITPRAAGTSLAGQALGPGLVIDTSRYMTDILAIDPQERQACVQPGVIIEELNRQVRSHGLQFAPDPSTANRCTVAGAIGNNAWGAHAPQYGTTREHVVELGLLLADGTAVELGPLGAEPLKRKLTDEGAEGALYRSLLAAVGERRAEILVRYPDPAALPCNMGYALHVLARMQPWAAQGAPFNLAALLCGSEGTLGLITQASVRLVPVPAHRVLLCAHFADLDAAVEAVVAAKACAPAAIELLDRHIMALTRDHLSYSRQRGWIDADPAAVLLIEFNGADAADVMMQADRLRQALVLDHGCYAAPLLSNSDAEDAWAIRRAGLGLLMGMPGATKPVTFIEDSAVPVAQLPGFVRAARALFAQHGIECVYYGSVSMGLVHLRPLLNLRDPWHRGLVPRLAGAIAELLLERGGTLSAKHGDGRVRSPFIATMLGPEVVKAMQAVKAAFDPEGRFNPGIIVEPAPPSENWRVAADAPASPVNTFFHWEGGRGILPAVERCHGAGVCRKARGPGVMCPSYRASLAERDTTRARANVFREALLNTQHAAGLASPMLHEVLDRCLACKGCKSDCPAHVDMARLKAEHLQHYHDQQGVPVQARLFEHFHVLAQWAQRVPRLANAVTQLPWTKRALGFAPQRNLPAFAPQTLSAWMRTHRPDPRAGRQGRVVLLNDVFSEYFEPAIGGAAVELLEQLGWNVVLSPCFPSARMVISQGLLRVARARIAAAALWLEPWVKQGTPIIGLEPSELLTFRDEAVDLCDGQAARAALKSVAALCFTAEEFVLERVGTATRFVWPGEPVAARVHVHCHQKALVGNGPTLAALRRVERLDVQAIDAGCCGMAGAFGYEQQHYELSLAIGRLALFPALHQAPANAVVVANGTSCRHQIRDGTGRAALHPVDVLRRALVSGVGAA